MPKVYVWEQPEIESHDFWDCCFPHFNEKNYEALNMVLVDDRLLAEPWSDGFAKFEEMIKNVKEGLIDKDIWDGNYFIATVTKDSVFFHTVFPEEDKYGFKLDVDETLELFEECKKINYIGNEPRACKRKKADEAKIVVASFNEDGEIFKECVLTEPQKITKAHFIVGQNLRLEEALYLKVGETKKICLTPFGNKDRRLIKDVDLTELPEDMVLEVGMNVALTVPDVGNAIGKVLEINDRTAKIDFNRPHAGELVYCTVTRIG